MRELIFYILLFTLGTAILIPALAIAVCASALVFIIKIKAQHSALSKAIKNTEFK